MDRSPSDVDNILRVEASRINATSQISNSVSLNFDGTTDVEFKSKHLVGDDVAELPKDYVTANSVDDDYFLKRDSGLPIDIEISSKLSDRSSNQEESASHSTFSSSKFEIKNDFVSHEGTVYVDFVHILILSHGILKAKPIFQILLFSSTGQMLIAVGVI